MASKVLIVGGALAVVAACGVGYYVYRKRKIFASVVTPTPSTPASKFDPTKFGYNPTMELPVSKPVNTVGYQPLQQPIIQTQIAEPIIPDPFESKLTRLKNQDAQMSGFDPRLLR